MNSNCRSFQLTKLTVWGSVLLMACTYSVSMADVTGTDTPEANFDQPAQPVYLETKDTPSPEQGENYPTQAESKPEPQPETPQEPGTDQPPATHEPLDGIGVRRYVTDQPPATHEPEVKDDTSSSQTDHVETLTLVEVNTNLIQGVNGPDGHRAEVSAPSDEEQVYATAQTKMVLPTLSRDTDLAEEA